MKLAHCLTLLLTCSPWPWLTLSTAAEWQCGQRPAMADGGAAAVASVAKRIVGGTEASVGQFPWQVQLYMRRKKADDDGEIAAARKREPPWTTPLQQLTFLCGATLITDRVVLTAAHCLKSDDVDVYQAVLGSHFRFEADASACSGRGGRAQRLAVRKFIRHANFDADQLLYDIAIVWIYARHSGGGQGVRLDAYVQPVCLPPIQTTTTSSSAATTTRAHRTTADMYAAGTTGTASGWGLTDEADRKSASRHLRFVSVPIVQQQQCVKTYSAIVSYNPAIQFCAGNTVGQDACAGDSGGPFVTDSTAGGGGDAPSSFVLIGIVSYGVGCGHARYPGVYVRVQSFVAWIRQHVDADLAAAAADRRHPSHIQFVGDEGGGSGGALTTSISDDDDDSGDAPVGDITSAEADDDVMTPSTTTTTTSISSTAKPSTVAPAEALQKGPICDGSYRYIACGSGTTINIVNVFHGRRRNDSTCRRHQSVLTAAARSAAIAAASAGGGGRRDTSDPSNALPCSSPTAQLRIERQCHGKRSCWVFHALFAPDPRPCGDAIDAYFTVFYACVKSP